MAMFDDRREFARFLSSKVDQNRYLRSLEDLIKIPSHAGAEEQITEWIAQKLMEIGLESVEVDRDYTVLGQIGNGKKCLLLFAHRNIQTPHSNAFDPCDPRIERAGDDLKIHGLGVASSKASTASSLEVLEIISEYLDQMPKILFASHAGSFSAGKGDVGHLLLQHSFDADGAIVAEPTGLKLGIAARGYMHLELTWQGKGCHASIPDNMLNPVNATSKYLEKVLQGHLPSHPLLGSATLTPIEIWSRGSRPMTPEYSTLVLDRRILPGEPAVSELVEELHSQATQLSGELNVEATLLHHQYPFEVDQDSIVVKSLAEGLRLATNSKPECIPLHFSCSAGTLQHVQKIPSVAFSGNQVAYLGPDEHVYLSHNLMATRALVNAVALFEFS